MEGWPFHHPHHGPTQWGSLTKPTAIVRPTHVPLLQNPQHARPIVIHNFHLPHNPNHEQNKAWSHMPHPSQPRHASRWLNNPRHALTWCKSPPYLLVVKDNTLTVTNMIYKNQTWTSTTTHYLPRLATHTRHRWAPPHLLCFTTHTSHLYMYPHHSREEGSLLLFLSLFSLYISCIEPTPERGQ